MQIKNKWALLNSCFLFIWGAFTGIVIHLYAIRFFDYPTEFNFFNLYNIILFPFSIFAIIFAYIKKIRFYIYSLLCILWGLGSIFVIDYIFAILLCLTSIVVFYRIKPKLYATKKFPIITGLVQFLLCCTIIYLRDPSLSTFIFLASKFVAFILLISLYVYILYPTYIHKIETTNPKLDCSRFNYSERQKKILTRVLEGEKYQSIADDFNTTTSTVKKMVAKFCEDLDVQDKTLLLATYANYVIV